MGVDFSLRRRKRGFFLFLPSILFHFVALASLGDAATVDVAIRTADTRSAAALHAEGLNYYNKGQYKEALEVWLEEFRLDPQNANTANNIGIACRNLKDSPRALEYHRKALELSPAFGKAYSGMGLAYFDLKDYEQAKTAFLKAIELKYQIGKSYSNLGLTYYELKNYEQGKISFLKAIELNYDLPVSYYELGLTNYRLKDFEGAAEALETTIKLNPSFPGAHYLLGICFEQLNRPFSAQREFKKEEKINSRYSKRAGFARMKLEDEFGHVPILKTLEALLNELIGFISPRRNLGRLLR